MSWWVSRDHSARNGLLFFSAGSKVCFFSFHHGTYQVKKRDDGRLVAVSTSSSMPISGAADDISLDVLLVDTKKGQQDCSFLLEKSIC